MGKAMHYAGAFVIVVALSDCASPAPARHVARHASMGIDAFGHTQLAPACAALSPELRAHAERLIALLRRKMSVYRDQSAARRAGFAPEGDDVPVGALKHWINPANVRIGWRQFDPERPSALLYRRIENGYQLAGVMFTAPYASSFPELNRRVPLALGQWHAHRNICQPKPGLRVADLAQTPRFGFSGSIARRDACEAAGGAFLDNVYGWMVHVYPFETTLDAQFGGMS